MNWRVRMPVWAAVFAAQVSASRPGRSWESVLDLAHRCGATAVEADIREELAAAGGRPRRSALTGVESLTPTELRVAQLAAQGISNGEIAEQTFVSRNTVAWHMRNIYRKLALESRDQLLTLIND